MSYTRMGLVLAGVAAAIAAPAPAMAATAPAAFASTNAATWDGKQVKVTFRETGAKPWSTGLVSIRATGTVDVVCVGGGVSLSSQSSAETETVAEHKADGNGVRAGEQVVAFSVQPPVITGLDCKPTLGRSFTVTVQDLSTGAVQTLAGPASNTGKTS